MSLLVGIIIGIIIGGGAGFLLLENLDSLFLNMVFGVVGSLLALAIYVIFGTNFSTDMLFSWPGTISCTIGALLIVLLFNGLHHIMPKRINNQQHAEDADLEKD